MNKVNYSKCLRKEAGQYMWRVGQDLELKLFVIIENGGEDAHEATLTVVLPKFIEYRGTDNEVGSSLKYNLVEK